MRPEDVRYCLDRAVGWIGFNFHPGSKRYIEPAEARRMWLDAVAAVGSPPPTRAAGVVVEPSLARIESLVADFPELEALQFHGKETPEDLAAARDCLGRRAVWKAVTLGSRADARAVGRYEGHCDLLLCDSAEPGTGGTGARFDWSVLAELAWTGSWALAGGLRPENVGSASRTKAALLDVCSGVESAPGTKDRPKIDALLNELVSAAEKGEP